LLHILSINFKTKIISMPKRKAKAIWNGDLKNGKGKMSFGSGAYEGAYTFKSRFEEGTGTNPEELIGAANAGCFSMALAADLADAGYAPESVTTNADVTLEMVDGDPAITTIVLNTKATVPDIEEDDFLKIAEGAKKNCPVSKALAGVNIELNAELTN
jgi:osmotically inducible protein OsmC